MSELVPGALAIVLVGYAEALGAANTAALQSGGSIDPNQELVAHGPANILSGLFGDFSSDVEHALHVGPCRQCCL